MLARNQVREREGGRERGSKCVVEMVLGCMGACVCVREREREREKMSFSEKCVVSACGRGEGS